ncbi:hypothetical protein SAMN04487907_104114 [Zunongwangia mangrovi]|uniref:Phage abortive infection protein n=1 Tax=Zunongwangia mangrovi TaxID=1334022 RepID=A0A1I1IZF0_9FLAO|nr:hypothetical protein [Zunongwangia mangrovi]SFC41545.1 hypothetical protein SAMN04487907_104114 [Zunongwangia mangrovi]
MKLKAKHILITAFVFILIILSGQIFAVFCVSPDSRYLDASNYLNNLLSPIISIIALLGVYYTYSQQQKNHKEQIDQGRQEFAINHLSSIYLEFKAYYEREVDEDYLSDLSKRAEKLDHWYKTYRPEELTNQLNIEDEIRGQRNFLVKLNEHIDNYNYLVDYISNSRYIDIQVKKSYLKRILYDIEKISINYERMKYSNYIPSEIVELYKEYYHQIETIIQKANNNIK